MAVRLSREADRTSADSAARAQAGEAWLKSELCWQAVVDHRPEPFRSRLTNRVRAVWRQLKSSAQRAAGWLCRRAGTAVAATHRAPGAGAAESDQRPPEVPDPLQAPISDDERLTLLLERRLLEGLVAAVQAHGAAVGLDSFASPAGATEVADDVPADPGSAANGTWQPLAAALDSRSTIWQAVGLLMSATRANPADALERLYELSRRRDRVLTVVARELLDEHQAARAASVSGASGG